MKNFKKILAVVLAAMLALTVLAGCSVPEDQIIPAQQTQVYDAYNNLINKASADGYTCNATYSRKVSDVAWDMLIAADGAYGDGDTVYSSSKDAAAKAAFEKAKADGKIAKNAVLKVGYLATNPTSYGSYKYDAIYTAGDFDDANYLGISYNGDSNHLMIIAVYIPASK